MPAQFSGSIQWRLDWTTEIENLCDGQFNPRQNANNEIIEFVMRIEANVTRGSNGQTVPAFSHTFVTSQSLNVGFSVPSPSTFYTDIPFESWVRTFILNQYLFSNVI